MATVDEERNRAFVLEAFDALFNRRDYAAAKGFWSPDYIQHSAHIAPGREGLFELVKAAKPDMRYENGLVVANGDYVMLHGRFTDIGQPANWIAADIVRIETVCSPSTGMSSKMNRPEKSPSAGYPCSAPPSRQRPDMAPPRYGGIPWYPSIPAQRHFRTNGHDLRTSTTQYRNEDELMARLDGKVAVITGGSSVSDWRARRDSLKKAPMSSSPGAAKASWTRPRH